MALQAPATTDQGNHPRPSYDIESVHIDVHDPSVRGHARARNREVADRSPGSWGKGWERSLFYGFSPEDGTVTGNNGSSSRRRRAWTRFAVLLSYGGGVIAGVIGITGLQSGFTPTLYTLGGSSLVILIVANMLAIDRFDADEDSKPLPGDVYGDREAPKPHEVDNASLDGRVPFSESKDVAKAEVDPEKKQLYERLEQLNKELQRANVKLGLGELSREGYTKIVEELKERRAKVEARLNESAVPDDL